MAKNPKYIKDRKQSQNIQMTNTLRAASPSGVKPQEDSRRPMTLQERQRLNEQKQLERMK